MNGKLLLWLGWAGFDAVGRLFLLTVSTTVFSRLLLPIDFGLSALVFTTVTIASVLVGAPFEESLAQRRHIMRAHAETATATALFVGTALFLLSFPLAAVLARFYQEPLVLQLLPAAMASIFFTGYIDISTGLLRRQRKFNDLAIASLTGNLLGIGISVAMAVIGFGIWSLIAQRLMISGITALVLAQRIGFIVPPKFSFAHFKDLRGYAGVSLADRLADNLNYFAFNNLVGAIYGLQALGYVNMAMRLIEPLRGAFTSTGHNLAFFYFAAVKTDKIKLRERADEVLTRAALVVAPVFVGLAAVMPVLLPLIAGPGWEPAVNIAICLGLGAAILLPARLIYTALSASARPEFSLGSNLANVAVTNTVLLLASGLGPINVGLARIAGDSIQSSIAVGLSPRHLDWSRWDRLQILLTAWLLSGFMGMAVIGFQHALPQLPPLVSLLGSVGTGVVVYAGLCNVFARTHFRSLVGLTGHNRKDAAPKIASTLNP